MTIKELKDKGLLLLECISGSKAYGLDTASSDTDIKGVFFLPREQFYGLQYIPQVSNETNDEVYYELGRFVELLTRNNPNMLELLASPGACILYRHPLMDELSMDLFLSALCKESFAGYAMTQVRKAKGYNKKSGNPMERERKTVLDFCFVTAGSATLPLKTWLEEHCLRQENCGLSALAHTRGLYALYTGPAYRGIVSGPAANEVSVSPVPEGIAPRAYLYWNSDHYSAYCREYREYWDWMALRNETRYKGNLEHGKQYDAKNMMHTIRLLQVAEEIGRLGILQPRRSNREELLRIRSGALEYEELLQMAGTLMECIDETYAHSSLPDRPDVEQIEAALVRMRTTLYHPAKG